MNNNILNSLLVGAATLALASCGENTWNDHFLDGFEGGVDYESAKTGSYALTADDYKAISDLMVAKASTDEEKAEAKAIATNCYFNKYGAFPASVALPPFLTTAAFPYYLASNGSQIDISYAECSQVPAELGAIATATEYTVSSDNYKKAWGSDELFINSFAPGASAASNIPSILKGAVADAADGAYAIVHYTESATNPIFMASVSETNFEGGTYYLVANGNTAAGPLATDKTYGYLNEAAATVSNGVADTPHVNAFTFEPAEGGFYLKDTYGRYLYQSGSYNSFNLSTSVPADGGVWTVEVGANGQATITNVSVGKWIQYSANYKSWGSYANESGVLPTLYHAAPNNGSYYLVADGTNGAGPVVSDKSYGYFPLVEMSVIAGGVQADAANAFTFEETEGGYYIKDAHGRYVYQSGTYNSFNFSANLPESGAIWSVSVDKDGLATITNTSVNKWIQYDSAYTSWGSYNSQKGTLPKLYMAAAISMVTETSERVDKNAVYYYDGSKWVVADGVSALNPADYEAMGVSNGNLSDPEIYIPLYLKGKQIYAQAGDKQFVVYNTNKVGLYVFDGSTWALNNNGLENVVGRYSKSDNAWSFTKYIGKATFTAFNEDQLILDRSYLLTYGNVCATPIDKGSNYGYLTVGAVTISGSNIVLPSDANAFTFASKATVDGVEYKVPDGKFLIVDSNGRYNYYDGSHASMQVKDAPEISGGAVAAGYCWTATRNSDGSWKIESDLGEGNVRWLVYSKSYNNFAIYNTITENDFAPSLYMMDE